MERIGGDIQSSHNNLGILYFSCHKISNEIAADFILSLSPIDATAKVFHLIEMLTVMLWYVSNNRKNFK